jgi:hypothetical protein
MKISIKKFVLWFSSIVIVLFAVLVFHIYIVTRSKNHGEKQRQLSRIDFKQAIDSAESVRIKRFVAHLEGVSATYFNMKDHILVYTYVVGKQTSEDVFNKLVDFGHYKAERYIVDAATAKTGCPMMDNDSFSGKLAAYASSVLK